MNTYSTRGEAIDADIIPAIKANGADVEQIANAVLGNVGDGWGVVVSEGEFWDAVNLWAPSVPS